MNFYFWFRWQHFQSFVCYRHFSIASYLVAVVSCRVGIEKNSKHWSEVCSIEIVYKFWDSVVNKCLWIWNYVIVWLVSFLKYFDCVFVWIVFVLVIVEVSVQDVSVKVSCDFFINLIFISIFELISKIHPKFQFYEISNFVASTIKNHFSIYYIESATFEKLLSVNMRVFLFMSSNSSILNISSQANTAPSP